MQKIHSLARKRGVEVLEVNPQDTSTIGTLKYAPQLHLSKDVAAAYVIGRRALGFEEGYPKDTELSCKTKEGDFALQARSPINRGERRRGDKARLVDPGDGEGGHD